MPMISRKKIDNIKIDLKETIQYAEDLNINVISLVRQKILLHPKEEQDLYWEIFLYLLENKKQ
jgi:hypothetical protein